MLVKNATPFFHGTKLTSRHPPQPELVLVVRGTFRLVFDDVVSVVEDLEQGFLSGDLYAGDDPDRSGALEHASDFADFKLGAEILFVGSAYPPRAREASCPVRLSVGDWKKELMVYGDRRWERGVWGVRATAPAPFERIPLDWAHAYGGKGFADNPVGAGRGGDLLPNVELPSRPILSPDDAPPPASMAPISPSWPPRAGCWGTDYGATYRKERFPYYAADFDWRYFSAAPRDQQLDGYLRGDELVILQNLHPERPVFRTKLPGLRVRAFFLDDRDALQAISMALDTLTVSPDKGTLQLTWRGVAPVREDDFADVTHVIVATEPLTEAPKDEAHYRAELEAFRRDPTGIDTLLPAPLREEAARLEQAWRGEEPPPREIDPSMDPLSGLLRHRFGALASDEHLAQTARISARADEHPDAKLDLAAQAAAAQARMGETDAPPMRVRKPGRLPDPRLRARMREIMAKVVELREVEKKAERRIEGLDALEAIPHDPRWRQLDPDYSPQPPLSTDAPGPDADLADRDLRGHDLRGVDLSRANLSGADLTRARLDGAKLAGANLEKAILFSAVLDGADLEGANLSLVNAVALRASGARLQGARLTEACFENATFEGAVLEGVDASYAIFEGADLRRVRGRGAVLDHADLTRARLAGADLVGASATLALFTDCEAPSIDLSEATATQASFEGAKLPGAKLTRLRAESAFFLRTVLDGADLSLCTCERAHFTEASARKAVFYGANLRACRFYRANLDGADLERSNLMGAELRKTNVQGARFRGASLYDAKLLDLRGGGYDLTDANLKASTVDRA
jgi:uncharacterized protein YjbI with pentapeptide repeats